MEGMIHTASVYHKQNEFNKDPIGFRKGVNQDPHEHIRMYVLINKQGVREEMTGSGHLGANFVGVASVREGRGMLPRGMPTLMHQVQAACV